MSVFSLGLAALAGEFFLRIVGWRMAALLPMHVRETYKHEPDADFIYRGFLPGTFEDFANPVHLNRIGLHDADYNEQRPRPETYRLLVLGDSYVAALSVPTTNIFHKILEARLNREDPLKRGSYEVIAIGQGHRAQEAELRWLREYGPMYKPNAVMLVFFCGNDFMENDPELSRQAAEFGSQYEHEVLPRKEAVFDRLLVFPHSRLNGALAEVATSWYSDHLDLFTPGITRAQLESPELGVYRHPLSPEWQHAYALTDALLRQIQTECREEGLDFWIACLSGPQAIGDASRDELSHGIKSGLDLDQPRQWLLQWCAANHVPVCDLEPDLVAAGFRKVFWRHDGHLNVYGNAIVAQTLYEFVSTESARTSPVVAKATPP